MLNVQEIGELIKLVDESSLNEFTYETSEGTVKLKKAENKPSVVYEGVHTTEKNIDDGSTANPAVLENNKAPVDSSNEAGEEIATKTDFDYEIVSPMVGTLYRASSPEEDPFVEKGSQVKNETIVCIVEAMKLFNEIEAEVAGEIVEVLVEDGELVEYGQPLFRVKK